VAMYEYWLPYRRAVYERQVAKSMQGKVGRNEPCPCGSGKKYKVCCGAASVLHWVLKLACPAEDFWLPTMVWS